MKALFLSLKAATVACVFGLVLAATGCTSPEPEPPSPGDNPQGLGFAEQCTKDEECQSGLCLSSGICSKTCGSNGDCPSFAPWACGGDGRCQCVRASDEDMCNLVDDDCNGVLDDAEESCYDGLQCKEGECQCPPERVCIEGECANFLVDPANCGGCGRVCGVNSACVDGECTCAGLVCDGQCVFPDVDDAHCGACGTVCGEEEECAGGCKPIDREWAAWTPRAGLTLYSPDIYVGAASGLKWQSNIPDAKKNPGVKTAFTYDEAVAYCASLVLRGAELETEGEFAEETGWRLPTRIELLSLVDYAEYKPALSRAPDRSVVLGGGESNQQDFWTSTVSAADPSKRRTVRFLDGSEGEAKPDAGRPLRVRCVK